ncbi:hypothetical protein P3T76_004336 [Phytophthora citrophthora]|uniref:Uncharacterized protein n=1 Tax=Phytophthora citrophthora TaxID=4793 RepID=A0AAD9LRT3_9STRA|nr:hypothetical protein P3T76_004336 [Phytophthora citrophthora]
MKGFGWSEMKSRGMTMASQLVAPTADITPKREQLEVSEKKPTPALDQPSTCGKNPPVEFFEWPIELSEAQRKPIDSPKAGFLAGVGDRLDGLLDGSTTLELKEVSQFLNPIIQSELRTIIRVYKQPAVTPADQERLRRYKKDHEKQQVALDNDDCKANVEDNVFKLDFDESSKNYRVRYASERIPFKNVIAITYAWHETEKKRSFHVYGRKEEKPIQLGVE